MMRIIIKIKLINKIDNFNKNYYDSDNNNENKNSDFNEDNKSVVNIFSNIKNILFSNKDKNKDEIFIFKQLQLNSNANKKNNNYNNYKYDSYWSKKYNIANNRMGYNIENTRNNDNVQKGYLNNIFGKK